MVSLCKTCILLIVAVIGILIVVTSFSYVPPQFERGFLRGRDAYFYSWYAIAFYVHIVTSPIALGIGMFQSIAWFRRRSYRIHRMAGVAYVWLVLLLATPSGLAMSIKAKSVVAVAGFAVLALATWWCTWRGYRAAKVHDARSHGVWMTRSYLLICAAVMLRFQAALVNTFDWRFVTYGMLAWSSWLPHIGLYELWRLSNQRVERQENDPPGQ